MGADFFFRMGATHAVCQDYALAGSKDGVQYAILSDGCSGGAIPGVPGSPFTDFGARLLVKAAERRTKSLAHGLWLADAIIAAAATSARAIGLPSACLDATLLVATWDGQGYLQVHQAGDGVVVIRNRDGRISYRSPEFGNGMPFYPRYSIDEDLRAHYLANAGSVKTTRATRAAGAADWDRAELLELIGSHHGHFERLVDPEESDLVLLCSDGVHSFQDGDGEPVPVEEVLDQLLDFKGFQGQFLGRRCQRFLGQFCAENGWTHADDFSVAGIYLGAQP